METKICSICKQYKPQDEFPKDKISKTGYRSCCKVCRNLQHSKSAKKYRSKNRDEISQRYKRYYEENQDKISQTRKKYYEENKEYFKRYYEKNRDEIRQLHKKYYEENKEYFEKYYEKNRDEILLYAQRRREENPEYSKIWYEENPEYNHNRIENMVDCYINQLLKGSYGLNNIPVDLIKTKKMQIKFKRLLKQKKDENTKTS